ncbi:sulfurtransferase TusA family protein [Wenzhouxiangella sp. XN201]|uniref:sulfurtransferase TusA family protein n=1 Tax=Wenzhouxiangella sp. XN201 TaxID=2710755 RepID=UPI0013C9D932|nr:sulfurtransferase TusA family protein [Wenzhouxiangella sp. XN201]NEZ02751.1 sulfurtransferase TusA family protein [Wenzhouxiangella sp. XN201]
MNESGADVVELDCRGLDCPQPVVLTRQAIADLRPGTELVVIATDPLAEMDLAVFCQRTGHEMIGAETRDGEIRIRIRVKPGRRPDAG